MSVYNTVVNKHTALMQAIYQNKLSFLVFVDIHSGYSRSHA